MLQLFNYGQHFPNAFQAVQWVTSPIQGTYREMTKIEYLWNYYDFPQPLPENHPYDKDSLIAYADGTNFTTCRDANAHLLFDYNHDGELDLTSPPSASFAYMEHSGRGVNNEVRGNPFSNFWFDDNSLAKWMNLAFNLPAPSGLHEYDDFTRWRIVGGNATNWTPYSNPSSYNDQLALNGLYYLAVGSPIEAMSCWKKILINSQYQLNTASLQYDYPGIHESYHFGLWLILTSMLHTLHPEDNTVLQHYLSIRSTVLSIQVKDASFTLTDGPFYGWTSDAAGGGSLMNTESVSTNVLGLGANAVFSYEFGRTPLLCDCSSSVFELTPYNYLSATEGLSSVGYFSDGPGIPFSSGKYQWKVYTRSRSITSASSEKVLLTLEIYDRLSQRIVQSREVTGKDFSLNKEWMVVSVSFEIEVPENQLDFRVWYEGCESIDASLMRIVKDPA